MDTSKMAMNGERRGKVLRAELPPVESPKYYIPRFWMSPGRAAAEGFSPMSLRAHWIGPEGRAAARSFSCRAQPEVPFLKAVLLVVCAAILPLTIASHGSP